MTSRPPDRLVLIAVAAVAALAATLVPGPLMPAFLPIGDHASYALAAPAALTWLEPVMHAPWLGSAPAAPAWAAAALVVLWASCRRLGAPIVFSGIAVAAWLARGDIATPWAHGAPAPLAVALWWVCLLLVSRREPWSAPHDARGDRRGDIARPMLGAVSLAAACALWPPVVVLAPVAIAVSAGTGPLVLLLCIVAAAAGVAGGLHVWAWRATALAGEAVSWRHAWDVATAVEPRGRDPFPWPPMASSTMPLALALVGGVVALTARARRSAWIAGVLVSLLLALAPQPWRLETSRAVYWAAWPLVAVGLAWVASQAVPRWRWLATAALTVVLVGSGLAARARLMELDEPRQFAGMLSTGLAPLVASGAVMVSEDTRVDTALVAWDGRAHLTRVRPEPALVSAALASGRAVLAGPSARTALELWGFRFAPGMAVQRPARFQIDVARDRFRCVPVTARWNELAGLEYSGRVGVHLPRGKSHLEVVVAGAAPLGVRALLGDGRVFGQITSETGTTLSRLPPVLWPGDGRLPDADAVMTRVDLPAHPDYDIDAAVWLGARAPLVGARLTGGDAAATVCAAPLPRFDPLDVVAPATGVVPVDDDAYFAGGWHQVEGSGAAAFRWTTSRAVLLVPSLRAQAVTLTLAARAAAPDARLRLTVNGVTLDDRDVTGATQDLSWTVPATLWLDGTNEIRLDVSRTVRPSDTGGQDPRELGVAVSRIRLASAQP